MSSVYFAYDGSIHGDWISHYAVRLAAVHERKTLHLVHVYEHASNDTIHARLDLIRAECARLGVQFELHLSKVTGTVFQTIRSLIPAGADNFLVCGTRGRDRKRGLLSGSVSEALLRAGACHVLAVRVVQPGLLGLPRRFLLPVSGHPRGMRAGLPFLRLFAPEITHLQLLYVARVSRWQFRLLSHSAAERLRHPGQTYCERIEREVCAELGLNSGMLEPQVVVSDDVPKEIVIAANKSKSRLIYLGASERNLTERFFFGNPIEQVLRDATCDVAIYRGLE